MPAITPHDVWNTLQPYVLVLLGEAAKAAGKRVPDAIGKAWEALTARLKRKPAGQEALEDLRRAPDDPDTQAAFRVQVKKLLNEDADFAAQLAALLREAGEHYQAALQGNGAIAQGKGATAAGKGAVIIRGNAHGNIIVTGDDNEVQR